MTLVTSYTQAKIDALLADLQSWASANLAPITEPLAVAAQADVDALTAVVAANDAAAVHDTGDEIIAGNKTFSGQTKFPNDAHSVGVGADGSAGTYVELGSLGSPTDAWVDARGSDADVNLSLRAKGAGAVLGRSLFYPVEGLRVRQTNVGGSTYTATLADEVIAIGATCTLTLPNNAGGLFAGKRYTIANTGSGVITISTTAGVVDFTTTIPAGNVINLWSDGFNYYNENPFLRIKCTSSTRPTGNLYAGLEIFETNTKRVWIYDGSAWIIISDQAGATYTPTLTNITGGTASGKYRYLNAKTIHIQAAITAGTWTTAGTVVTVSLPSGIQTDSFMTQVVNWNFNTNISPTGYASGGASTMALSYINPQTAGNIAAGTSMANARIEAVLSIA